MITKSKHFVIVTNESMRHIYAEPLRSVIEGLKFKKIKINLTKKNSFYNITL